MFRQKNVFVVINNKNEHFYFWNPYFLVVCYSSDYFLFYSIERYVSLNFRSVLVSILFSMELCCYLLLFSYSFLDILLFWENYFNSHILQNNELLSFYLCKPSDMNIKVEFILFPIILQKKFKCSYNAATWREFQP